MPRGLQTVDIGPTEHVRAGRVRLIGRHQHRNNGVLMAIQLQFEFRIPRIEFLDQQRSDTQIISVGVIHRRTVRRGQNHGRSVYKFKWHIGRFIFLHHDLVINFM